MEYVYGDCLIHHGVKGQKWGVRRYQNIDGTLTAAGKKRYGAGVPLKKVVKNLQKDLDAKVFDPENLFNTKTRFGRQSLVEAVLSERILDTQIEQLPVMFVTDMSAEKHKELTGKAQKDIPEVVDWVIFDNEFRGGGDSFIAAEKDIGEFDDSTEYCKKWARWMGDRFPTEMSKWREEAASEITSIMDYRNNGRLTEYMPKSYIEKLDKFRGTNGLGTAKMYDLFETSVNELVSKSFSDRVTETSGIPGAARNYIRRKKFQGSQYANTLSYQYPLDDLLYDPYTVLKNKKLLI